MRKLELKISTRFGLGLLDNGSWEYREPTFEQNNKHKNMNAFQISRTSFRSHNKQIECIFSQFIYAHVSNAESHMILETLLLVHFHKMFTLSFLQDAALGLPGPALPAPALPPLLPPPQGAKHRPGDLLPGRHIPGVSMSRQHQQHNSKRRESTAEPQ